MKNQEKSKEELRKSKIVKYEMIAAITSVLILSLWMFQSPGITGFLSLDFTMQDLNLDIDQNKDYMITSSSNAPFYLTSFKLGGEVVGEGVVEAYIDNGEGQRLLVFRNVRKISKGMGLVTGMFAEQERKTIDKNAKKGSWLIISPMQDSSSEDGPVKPFEGEEPVSGVFSNECGDTCFMKMRMSNEDSYRLIFKIEPGTKLRLDNIIYTIETDIKE